MKKTIFALAFGMLITGGMITSCSSSADKVSKAEKDVIEADLALEKARAEYKADMDQFKTETADKIAKKNQSFSELLKNAAFEKKEAKAEYEKQVKALEQSYAAMKKRMDDYNEDGKENWEAFKIQYNKDLDELNAAYNDLTSKGNK